VLSAPAPATALCGTIMLSVRIDGTRAVSAIEIKLSAAATPVDAPYAWSIRLASSGRDVSA